MRAAAAVERGPAVTTAPAVAVAASSGFYGGVASVTPWPQPPGQWRNQSGWLWADQGW